jgi:hypothetical protein
MSFCKSLHFSVILLGTFQAYAVFYFSTQRVNDMHSSYQENFFSIKNIIPAVYGNCRDYINLRCRKQKQYSVIITVFFFFLVSELNGREISYFDI